MFYHLSQVCYVTNWDNIKACSFPSSILDSTIAISGMACPGCKFLIELYPFLEIQGIAPIWHELGASCCWHSAIFDALTRYKELEWPVWLALGRNPSLDKCSHQFSATLTPCDTRMTVLSASPQCNCSSPGHQLLLDWLHSEPLVFAGTYRNPRASIYQRSDPIWERNVQARRCPRTIGSFCNPICFSTSSALQCSSKLDLDPPFGLSC